MCSNISKCSSFSCSLSKWPLFYDPPQDGALRLWSSCWLTLTSPSLNLYICRGRSECKTLFDSPSWISFRKKTITKADIYYHQLNVGETIKEQFTFFSSVFLQCCRERVTRSESSQLNVKCMFLFIFLRLFGWMCCFLPVELFYGEIIVQNNTNKSQWKSPLWSPSSHCLLVSAPLVQTQSLKKFQPPHPRLLSPCHLPPSWFFFFSLYPSTPSQTPIHTNSCIVSQTNSLLSVPSAPSPLHPARHINPSAAAWHPGPTPPPSPSCSGNLDPRPTACR